MFFKSNLILQSIQNLNTGTHRVCNTFSLTICCSSLVQLSYRDKGRQMVFLTLPPSHPLISFTFSNVPVRSSLVQSEESELCAIFAAASAPGEMSMERLLQLTLPSVTMQELPEKCLLLLAASGVQAPLLFPSTVHCLYSGDNHFSNYPQLL